jgi:hypothetical protein
MSGDGASPELLSFLIADVRGYTSFTQSRGDEAGAALAAAFAGIAREGIEAYGGRLLELRGDEALAVFSSVRASLRAAVALQEVFADETRLGPTCARTARTPGRTMPAPSPAAISPRRSGNGSSPVNLYERTCPDFPVGPAR